MNQQTEQTNNTEQTKTYDRKGYHNTFMKKNEEKIKQRIICESCYGKYTYFNKSKHNKSKRHITAVQFRENQPIH